MGGRAGRPRGTIQYPPGIAVAPIFNPRLIRRSLAGSGLAGGLLMVQATGTSVRPVVVHTSVASWRGAAVERADESSRLTPPLLSGRYLRAMRALSGLRSFA